MRKGYTQFLGMMLAIAGFLSPFSAQSQCANNNTLWATVGNINPGQTVTVTGTWGGEYNTFNCVSGATYVISTCNGGSWDSQLTLYNNTGGSALAYNDDFCGLQSQITWTATFNGTVRVLLDRYNCSSNTTSMTMTITRNGGGSIGNCWDGNINGTGSASASTCSAGNESNLRSSADRIYRVQIQQAGCYDFSLCGSSSWDSYLYLTTACPGNTPGGGTIIASNDDACGLLSSISNVTLATGTYYITVEGWSSTDCGNFTLNVSNSVSSAPSAGSITVPSAFGCGSTSNFSVPFHSGITYNWSTTNGTIVSGQGTNSVSIAWGSGSGVVSVVPTNACGVSGASSSVVAACTPPPANDNCANAISFTGSSQPFSNMFATGTDISSCTFNDFNDVWYSWTAPSCGQVTFSTVCGANFDTHLSLYTSCGGTEIACNDDAYDYSCNYGLTSRITANVTAGQTYLLRVAGYNGAQGTGTVSMSMSSPLSVTANAGSIACNGGNTTVTVSANGGSGVYAGTGTFTVTAGTYTYTVSDANGCSEDVTVTVTEPELLTSALAASDYNGYGVSCFGSTDGSVTVNAAGGTAPYTGTGVFNNLSAGSYSYTVTDANGCSVTENIVLVEPTKVNISATNTAILCNGGNSDVTVNTWGGVTPYSVNDAGSYSVPAGNYTYNVVDANGCAASTSISIAEPALLTVNAGSDETVFYGYGPMECADLSATAAGGTTAYNYSWTSLASGGGMGSTLTACPTSNEVYTVTVVDANGCVATDDLSICVVDVHCEAGNSGIMKVEMCQVPPGNPANAHTICIDASAVPAHLAIGCQLGACGELATACSGSAAKSLETEELAAALVAYPNPTENTTTISVTLTKGGNYSVEMFDMMGKLVKTVYAGSFEDYENLEFDVDMTNLQTGVYMISVSNGDQKIENIRVMKN